VARHSSGAKAPPLAVRPKGFCWKGIPVAILTGSAWTDARRRSRRCRTPLRLHLRTRAKWQCTFKNHGQKKCALCTSNGLAHQNAHSALNNTPGTWEEVPKIVGRKLFFCFKYPGRFGAGKAIKRPRTRSAAARSWALLTGRAVANLVRGRFIACKHGIDEPLE